MHVTIHGQNVRVTESIRGLIGQKLERIKTHTDKIIDAHVILKRVKTEYTAEITVMVDHRVFRCAKKATSLNESIDSMIDAVEKKLKRLKDIIKNHKHADLTEANDIIIHEGEKDDVKAYHFHVHEIMRKPMDNIEALLQIDAEQKPYFAYFQIEKNIDMLNVQIGKYPVFMLKPNGGNELLRYVYKPGGKGLFAKLFGSQDGWRKKRVKLEDKKEMKVLEEEQVSLPEYNPTQASHVLDNQDADGNFLVYINNITGHVEGMYREGEHKFAVLRYADM